MQSINYKRRNSLLTIENDIEPIRQKSNAGRFIYMAILLAIAGFIGYYLFMKFYYIQADGQVIFKNIDIRLTEPSRIVAFMKEEGDNVNAGDTLFSYVRKVTLSSDEKLPMIGKLNSMEGSAFDNDKNKELISSLEKDTYTYQTQLMASESSIKEAKRLLSVKRKDAERLQNLAMLENIPRSQYENYVADTLQLASNIEKLQGESRSYSAALVLLNKRINDLKRSYHSYYTNIDSLRKKSNDADQQNSKENLDYFLSPIKGTINNVYLSEFETVTPKDNILSIQHRNQIFIKAYFDQADFTQLKENSVVTIKFPDNATSKGYIKRFYYGTYALPEEFQKKYETVKRTVAADIFPINNNEAVKWKQFNKLSVKILFAKY